MKRLVIMLGLIAIALSACGGGGGGGRSFDTAKQLVDALAAKGITCTGFSLGEELYTRSNATCSLSEDLSLDVATFASGENRDNWINTAKNFGGVFVVGANWAVSVNDPDTAKRIRGAIGGTVR